jgi:mannose-1-phosphate guanylyltransferase
MEKSQNLIAIPVSFGWSDVGSFLAIASLFPSDSFENVARIASLASLDSRGNIVVSDDPKTHVALIGVENCVIAVSQGNVLVCKKTETDSIKKALTLFN